MVTTRAACVGVVAFAGMAVGETGTSPTPVLKPATLTSPAPEVTPSISDALRSKLDSAVANRAAQGVLQYRSHDLASLAPRQALPKMPSAQLAVPEGADGRLIIKFKDDWRVNVIGGQLVSEAGRDLAAVNAIAVAAGLEFEPAIKKSRQRLAQIELRAASFSGVAQPFLSGYVYLDGPNGVSLPIATKLNSLDAAGLNFDPVEFLHYEPVYKANYRPPAGGGEDPDCGAVTDGCTEIHASPYCSDLLCCTFVCTIDPFCCDEQIWGARGGAAWDDWCVDHALELCLGNPLGGGGAPLPPFAPAAPPTPSMTDAQGYLSPLGYIQEWGFIPTNVAYALKYNVEAYPSFLDGFSGEGYRLQRVWELAQFLEDHGIGQNLSKGRTIKVGVLEGDAFVSTAIGPDEPYMHEDLHGKVIPEPGHTPIIIPGSESDGNHGTATLGIIGAIDHDAAGVPVPVGSGLSPDESRAEEVGMVGIAPEAELWFFPTVSVESGGRLLDAMASALEEFGPGDVLNFSIGPGGCGTLASVPANWTLLRLATDLGVTACISAGNDCCDLALSPQAFGLDCGAIIVGAAYPGCDLADADLVFPPATTFGYNCYCRMGFSNHCSGDCTADTQVHVSGWGTAVATLGYGDLFVGDSNNSANRAYTSTFGGTSAAAPMVAGLVATMQGVAKQFYGIPFTPEMIRQVVSGTGYRQCGVANPGDHAAELGGCPAIDSASDWDQEEEVNVIGIADVAFTNSFAAAVSIITGNWFDGNGLVSGVNILAGTHVFGNDFSVKESENAYLVVEAEFKAIQAGGHSPLNPNYLATGQWTDIVVEGTVDVADVNGLGVAVEAHVNNGFGLGIIELFNWETSRYDFLGVQFLGRGDNVGFFAPFLAAEAYVRSTDDKVMIRAAVVSLGGISSLSQQGAVKFRTFYDVVSLFLNGQDVGDIFDP